MREMKMEWTNLRRSWSTGEKLGELRVIGVNGYEVNELRIYSKSIRDGERKDNTRMAQTNW